MTKRIVLLEDDPDIAALVREMMDDVDRRLELYEGLTDGAPEPAVDLVITDLVAQRVFDPAATRAWVVRVRDRYPNARIVVTTAHAEATVGGPEMIRADAVIGKPFDIATFSTTVEGLLGD